MRLTLGCAKFFPLRSCGGQAGMPICHGDIAIVHIEGIFVYSSAARDYILAAVPSGAAQEPGTLPSGAGHVQITLEIFKLSLPLAVSWAPKLRVAGGLRAAGQLSLLRSRRW